MALTPLIDGRYQFWILDFGFWIEALSVGTLRLTICSPAIIKTVAYWKYKR
jgi:hypothetical protein